MELIDKAAVVAEIEKRLKEHVEQFEKNNVILSGIKAEEDLDIISFLNTIKVKDVDLKKEINDYFDNYEIASKEECYLTHEQACVFARHFFELGLNARKEK